MQAPICEPLPRDTVLLAYLRRDDYVVRAVDPYLNPRWNVSVGEIVTDELDASYVCHVLMALRVALQLWDGGPLHCALAATGPAPFLA